MTTSFAWGNALPTLQGPRVALRSLAATDALGLFEIFGDLEVMRYWSSPPLPDLEAALKLVDEIHTLFASRTLFQWGIADRENDRVIGTCTLFNHAPAHGRAEVGFALARSAWGHGYGSEALGLLIRFAFDTLGLHRLEADVDPENARSLRLLERHGFKREGHLRERWHVFGRFHDTIYMGLLRAEA